MSNSWKIEYKSSVIKKDLPKISAPIRTRIIKSIGQKLSCLPEVYGKPLKHALGGYWSLRVGDFRVIYKLEHEKNLVTIHAIEHRRLVYEGEI